MSDKIIIEICNSSLTMAEAARKANMPMMTFRRKALKLGCYNPNPSGRGTYKPVKTLDDVFSGKTGMHSCQLRIRLIREGYKENKCERCGIHEWQGEELVLELDHINGNGKDNRLQNLRLLCPNCHSLTPTFRGRKNKK